MIVLFQYLWAYLKRIQVNKFLLTTLLVAVLVVINYRFDLERNLKGVHPWYLSLFLFFSLYSFVFGAAHLISSGLNFKKTDREPEWIFGIFLSAFLFAGKVVNWKLSAILPGSPGDPWNRYWTIVLQLPVKLCALLIVLYFIWKKTSGLPSFFGLTLKNIRFWPYTQVILLMAPVIALASLRPDFQHYYPRVQTISFIHGWPYQFLFELSYGLDFLSIEFFFRGLLVLGFIRFAGENAILPMAAFYCTVHFGKPLGECIGSYFGGIFLGAIAYRTRSILGGLMVHLGIAWLMELCGWLALTKF